MSRRTRLRVRIRNSPVRQVRRTRNRHYRRVWAILRAAETLPPDDGYRPWADPEYTGVLDDLRAAARPEAP